MSKLIYNAILTPDGTVLESQDSWKIHQSSYIFTEKSRSVMEKSLNAKFLMDIDPGHGFMGALLYSENPDVSKGHVHYLFVRYNGDSAFVSTCQLKEIPGILEDGVFYYSSHRHDYVQTPKGVITDGGVYYTRTNGEIVTMVLEPSGPVIERH